MQSIMRPLVCLTAIALLAPHARLGAQRDTTPLPAPPPGRLVDVGGRKLHLLCSGAGSPTVILEAGASAFAIDWALVQPEIARTNRVCSYDRAGHGWSDPDPGALAALNGSRDSLIADDLHS